LIEKITEDCFRFFGFKSFDEVDRLTLPEYSLLCKAYKLSTVDKDMWIHKQAYLNFMANAKKKAGKDRMKPVYEAFDKFYDYKGEIEKVEKEYGKKQPKFAALAERLSKERRENESGISSNRDTRSKG
jgi:hypothetical protein